jgi:hypothetical protein
MSTCELFFTLCINTDKGPAQNEVSREWIFTTGSVDFTPRTGVEFILLLLGRFPAFHIC